MENLKIDDLKNIHDGSNENLDGAKSWLNKQHNRLWESVGAGIAQQGNPEGWKNKTGWFFLILSIILLILFFI